MPRSDMSESKPSSLWTIALAVGAVAGLAWGGGLLGEAGSNWRLHALIHISMWSLVLVCIFFRPRFKFSPAYLILLAILLRLLYLPIPASNDTARYLWEGQLQQLNFNPYTLPPQHHTLTHLRDTPVWDDINHKDKTAIYPPGFQLLMRGAAWAGIDQQDLKWAFIFVDVINCLLLLHLLKARDRDPKWSLLFIANPMILMSFAGEAHLDVLMVFGMLAALYSFTYHQPRRMFLALAFAFHIKYFALLLLPFLLRRKNMAHTGWLILPAILPFLFFSPLTSVFTSLQTFGQDMHFNGSLHALLGYHLDNYPLAARCMAVFFLMLALLIRMKTPNPFMGGSLLFTALLLCSPNVHVWYLSWLAPFLAFTPLRSGLIWMGTIALAYHAPGMAFEQGQWEEVSIWTWLAYVPVFLGLIVDLRRGILDQPLTHQPEVSANEVSILIPTFSEAERLPAFFTQLEQLRPAPRQILFSDGGSTDGSIELIQQAGHPVLHSKRGRGTQLHAAIPHVTGSTVLILHADMQFPADILSCMVDQLNQSAAVGGAAGCRYRSTRPFLRGIALANRLRAQGFGLAFGDQAIFFRTDSLSKMGGFPNLRIMEDVECSLRIREIGPFLYLNHPVSVSDRQWRKRSPVRHTLLVIRLLIRYFSYRAVGKAASFDRELYHAYYTNSTSPVPRDTGDDHEFSLGERMRILQPRRPSREARPEIQ